MENRVEYCDICGSDKVKQITVQLAAPQLLEWSGVSGAEVMKCPICGTFYLTKYYTNDFLGTVPITAYADVNFEDSAYEIRKRFFSYLMELSIRYADLSNSKCILDIGCGFGHMLETFRQGGFEVFGVEILDSLRDILTGKGYKVFKFISDIPLDVKFDIIFLIDSLCYFDNPSEVLNAAKNYLKDNGIIIARISNRGLIIDLFAKLGKDLSSIFGTGKYNFGNKAFRIILEKYDYKIIKIIYNEKGKKLPYRTKLVYKLAGMLSYLTGMEICSGVIVISKIK
jgi:SAM-dependent methyltransferase